MAEISPDNDWDSIDKFCAGDPLGFEEIFKRYRTRVFRIANRFVKDSHTAEDIAHEVFIKIFEKKLPACRLPAGKAGSAKFSTWLYRVTVNAAIDVLRKRKFLAAFSKSYSQAPGDLSPGVRPLGSDPALNAALMREVGRLPESLKSPLLLFTFEDLSYAEIAQILGISEKAVERRLARAREILRLKLGSDPSCG